jgi:hypothetical protein
VRSGNTRIGVELVDLVGIHGAVIGIHFLGVCHAVLVGDVPALAEFPYSKLGEKPLVPGRNAIVKIVIVRVRVALRARDAAFLVELVDDEQGVAHISVFASHICAGLDRLPESGSGIGHVPLNGLAPLREI